MRDYAFDRVADIGSPNAIPSLWPLIQATGCASSPCSEAGKLAKRLRWRAGEMALSIGGSNIVNQFWAGFQRAHNTSQVNLPVTRRA